MICYKQIYQNGKNRLLIEIIYDLNDNQNLLNQPLTKIIHLKIILIINGHKINNINSQYNEDKNSALVPYALNLNKIRGKDKTEYISKVLLFSKNYEINIFYLYNGAPVELF